MSEPEQKPNTQAGENQPAELVKPTLSFESVTFSNRDTLQFHQDDLVALVGPNNAGKSAALREMEQFVSHSIAQKVIKAATFRRQGTQAEFRAYLEKHAQRVGDVANYRFAGMGYNIHHSQIQQFDNAADKSAIAGFFCTRLATENRITSSNPAGAIALYKEPPTHPIHLLLTDNNLAASISSLFRQAFGQDLIVFRAGGGNFPLLVGRKPSLKPGQDELSRLFVERLLRSADPLEQQGDGMRSFVSVLLYVLASDHHSIQFLDEPEAFLHPPQARLIGEFIARERRTKSQLFIATHSTDVLDGLIAGGAGKVRIIRIQREENVNRIKELSNAKTTAIANDTLTRYSRVLDGIFYEHVVVCESDADCLFYGSILNTKAISGDQRADVLFIHTAGKHRMARLAETLRELDVPVSVIADVDLIREQNSFQTLFEILGGDWSKVDGHLRAIRTSIEERRAPLNAEQVAGQIRSALSGVGGVGGFPEKCEAEIKRIFKTLSPWDEVKRAGRSALSPGQPIQHFDELLKECSAVGLWIVPVGEMEGFCRSIDGGHGPSFVAKVLEQRSVETDLELQQARDFVSKIWERARRNPTRQRKDAAMIESDAER